jgi:hypothetical protein
MKGGTIENNWIGLGGVHLTSGQNGVFEMFDGAEIRNNKIAATISSTQTQTLYGTRSAVLISTGRFDMHGGAIKDNDVRGVTLNGNGALYLEFIMEGGEISGNGTGNYTYSSAPVYIWGAGVYANQTLVTITGGSITNNGHENSIASGLFIIRYDSNPERILINGPVNFDGNTVSAYVIYFGSSFENAGQEAIQLESGYIASSYYTAEELCAVRNDFQVLAASPTYSGIDLAAATTEFELIRLYSGNTGKRDARFYVEEVNRAITTDGKFSVSTVQ